MLNPHNWFALQLKPNALSIAERNLKRQGFDVFSPKRAESQRKTGQFATKHVPLFKGYVFVNFDPEYTSWHRLNHTRGVTRLVGDGRGRPVPLPSEFMSQLINQCDESGVFLDTQPLKVGSEVRIVKGPFADYFARIETNNPNGRVAVLLEIMGQAVRAYVPRASVERPAPSDGS